MRFATAVLALQAVLGWGCAQASDTNQTAEGPLGCHFHIPEEWRGSGMQWRGECRNTLADGLGVVTVQEGRRTPAACPHQGVFYGEMAQGHLSFGVIDTKGGYMPGSFRGGAVEETEDRNVVIRAFRVASQAARAASEKFRGEGDAACSRRYAVEADRLRDQMD